MQQRQHGLFSRKTANSFVGGFLSGGYAGGASIATASQGNLTFTFANLILPYFAARKHAAYQGAGDVDQVFTNRMISLLGFAIGFSLGFTTIASTLTKTYEPASPSPRG